MLLPILNFKKHSIFAGLLCLLWMLIQALKPTLFSQHWRIKTRTLKFQTPRKVHKNNVSEIQPKQKELSSKHRELQTGKYWLATRPNIVPVYLINQGSHSDWKTWKMGKHFPVGEFLIDWKSQEKPHKIAEKSENFR